MLKAKRQDLIMQKLEKDGVLNVAELSSLFQCSEETIRRDLKVLELRKGILRTYGGAMKVSDHRNVPYHTRNNLLKKEKFFMAQKVMFLLHENMLISLDSSSTCFQIVSVLLSKNIPVSILTNSMSICDLVASADSNINLHCSGGNFHTLLSSFHGPSTLQDIENFYTDIAFISCSKIHLEYGLMDDNLEEAQVRKALLTHAKLKILILDHTKFYGMANHIFYPLEKIDMVITDKPLQDDWKQYFTDNQIEVIYT